MSFFESAVKNAVTRKTVPNYQRRLSFAAVI